MNLTALKTWVSGETLTATDLNGEFQNIYTHTITNSDIDSTGTYVLGELVVGSGITAADGGQFHVHTASAGSVQAHADANEAVLENSAASGLSILSGSSSDGNIFFGDAADNDIGKIAYSHSANSLAFTTNGTTALTLSSAQAATFAGDVSVGGALTLTGGLTLNGAVVVGDSASDTLTVNATVTSDLLFTDATYDIGKSGATRPRDGFFSRNMAVGGTLGVTGLITATGGVSGALTGNVTGNVTGNLTGDVTGNISGNVTGGTISGTTGTYTGALSAQTLTANNGALYLDDNGTHNGLINVPASLFLNIDSDNGATNEKFQIAKDRSGSSGGTVLFELGEDGDLDVTGGISGTTGTFSGAVNANNLVLDASGNYPILLENQAGTTADAAISTFDDANGTLLALGSNFYFSSGGAETRFNTSEEAAGIVLNRTGTISLRTSDGSNNTVERVSVGNTGDVAVATDVLFVDASESRVGIGTVSPSSLLHLSASDPQIAIQRTGAYSTSDGPLIQFTGKGPNGTNYNFGKIQAVSSGSNNAGELQFFTNSAGVQSERARIDSSGNLTLQTNQAADTALAIYNTNSSASAKASLKVGYDSANHLHIYRLGNAADIVYNATQSGSSHQFLINSKEAARFTQSNGSGGLTLKSNAGNNLIVMGPEGSGGNEENAYIAGFSNGTQKFALGLSTGPSYLNTGQNFGIGTASPVALSNQTSLTINGTSVGRVDVKAGGGGGGVMFGTSSALTVQANSGVAVNLDSASGQPITFQVGSSEKARILSSGGITFNGDTSSNNALSDYEIGTWTITDQSGAGVTFTTNSNNYTKIGRLVFFALEITSISATGTAQFTLSLPFTSAASGGRWSFNAVTNSTDTTLSGYLTNNNSSFTLIESDTSPATITNASMNGSYLVLTGCYEAT